MCCVSQITTEFLVLIDKHDKFNITATCTICGMKFM